MKFSLLISVYQKENPKYFNECLTSCLSKQTRLPDQTVIVVDGPITKELNSEIEKWIDNPKLLVQKVVLKKNMGLAAALNYGLKFCKHQYVCRMDTDDIAMPLRFEKQIEFLKSNKDIDVCGTNVVEFSEESKNNFVKEMPVNHEEIKRLMRFRNPINHPTVCFKKKSVEELNGYPEIYPEDYIPWVNLMLESKRFAKIPIPLVKMRVDNNFLSRRNLNFFSGEMKIFIYMYKKKFLPLRLFIFNACSRFILRISPNFLKNFFYSKLR